MRVGDAGGPPGAPLQLAASVTGNLVSLGWQPGTGPSTSAYLLEAGSGPGLTDVFSGVLGAGTSFSAAGVPAGTYFLRVKALNGWGTSAPSGELILVVP